MYANRRVAINIKQTGKKQKTAIIEHESNKIMKKDLEDTCVTVGNIFNFTKYKFSKINHLSLFIFILF